MNSPLESLKSHLVQGNAAAYLRTLDADVLTGLLPALAAEKLDLLCWQWIKDNPHIDSSAAPWRQLHQDYLIEQAYFRYRLTEIQQLESVLGDVPFLVLKGPALLYRLGFTQVHKRSDDLDILTRKSDIPAIFKKLTSAGYQRIPSKTNGEFSMMRDKNTTLDIHYELTASSPFIYLSGIEMRHMFAASERVTIHDSTMRTLCTSHTLIHLVIHFAVNHQFNEFILLVEIAEYLRQHQSKLNWTRLTNYLNASCLAEAFYICLALLARLGETKITIKPRQVLRGRRRALKVDAWIQEKQLLEYLLAGRQNQLKTNDFPSFCANTVRKRVLYDLGNLAWVRGDYV